MKFKKLKESLDFNKQADLNSRIYKAVSSAIFDSGMLDVTANDVTTAFNEFNRRFFNESLNESVDESTEQEIFDFIDSLGGYGDYNGKIDSVMDKFGLTFDEAEDAVWNWTMNQQDIEDEAETEETSWIKVISKPVPDSDGFLTDYTMYRDINDENHYVFVFGDNDIYKPEDGDWDYEAFSNSEATEWYNNYEGFTEEDEE